MAPSNAWGILEEKPQIFDFLAIKTRGQLFLKLGFSWEFRAHPHVNFEESRFTKKFQKPKVYGFDRTWLDPLELIHSNSVTLAPSR